MLPLSLAARKSDARITLITPRPPPPPPSANQHARCCIASVLLAFAGGVCFGVLLPAYYHLNATPTANTTTTPAPPMNHSVRRQMALIEDDIYWSTHVESLLPAGFNSSHFRRWSTYVTSSSARAVRLDAGCGRMQNRLVTFADGARACVRYRQNTDQLQGELFSFYLARLLRMRNVLPSAASVVDVRAPLWSRVADAIATAQWRPQRPLILTEYVGALAGASIPTQWRPNGRHLHPPDVAALAPHDVIELAQWSDLIVFDYLTANLDRVVNNLYNRQWNANIMDAPAHNLARRTDDDGGALLFLDNESGLLHGYRLLDKYEPYHAGLLDNLCVFRRQTALALRRLQRRDAADVGAQLRDMYARDVSAQVRDALPVLPARSVRILSARMRRVQQQIDACAARFRAT